MMWVVLAMGLFTDLPIRHVFKKARQLRAEEKTPPRSSLCEARQRLGAEPVAELLRHVVRPLATPQTPGASWKGRRLMAFNSTALSVPESEANAAAFARADGGRGPGGFPQVRKASPVELGTHVEVALALGGRQDDEKELARTWFGQIPADAIVLLDRGFFRFAFWETRAAYGVAILARIKSHMVLQPLRYLADGSFLAKVYESSSDRAKDRHGTVVRAIEYTLDDPQRVGHGERHRLMTNVLGAAALPALAIACGYHERWEHELTYDEPKTNLDPARPGKAAHLRSGAPEGVRQEVLALSLGHFVVRARTVEAAEQIGVDPDRLSFTGCLRILRDRLSEGAGLTGPSGDQWCQTLLGEMQQEIIEPRRNRINPRVVKRKMSKFKKKRPEHRSRPPLKKTSAETVVIT